MNRTTKIKLNNGSTIQVREDLVRRIAQGMAQVRANPPRRVPSQNDNKQLWELFDFNK